MTARRRYREWEVVAVLIHQGIVVTCFRCKEPFAAPTGPNQIQREHLHEIGLDGPDEPSGCRFSHAECHSRVTNGNGATTANSSKGKIAKAKRMEKARLALTTSSQKKPRRTWPKGRKLGSRPFPKRPVRK